MNRLILLIVMVFLINTIIARESNDIDSIVTNLGEIEVVVQHKLVKQSVGKIEYDVKGDKDSSTMTIMEMLRKVPMVSVDANDNIQINGSKDFVIYKNGKPSGLFTKNPKETLSSMPAGLVKRIEVISDPGAQYDAEGVNGILNIIMDERSIIDGVVGSARALANTAGMCSGSFDLTTQLGNVTINGNYGYNYYGKKQQLTKSKSEITYKESGNREIMSDYTDSPGRVHNVGLSASWDIDSLNLVTVSIDGQFMKFEFNTFGTQEMYGKNGSKDYSFDVNCLFPPYNQNSINVRADYQHKTLLPGEILSFSYLMSYSDSKMNGKYHYENAVNMPVSYRNISIFNSRSFCEHTFQLDYIRPMFKIGTFNVGTKYILRHNHDETCYNYDNGNNSNSDFLHYSHIVALYGEYSININRWKADAGIRYEYSRLGGKYLIGEIPDFYRDLNDIIPIFGASYEINDKSSLSLNYNMRIKRPSISRLNPFVNESPSTVSSGNPNLVSANQHSLSAGYMFNSRLLTLNTSLRYTTIDNSFVNLLRVKDNVLYSTYANVGKYSMWSLQGYAQWNPFSKTQLILNYGIYNQEAENKAMNIRLNCWRVFCYARISQQLPWKLQLSLDGGRNGGNEITPYSYQEGCYFYSFGLQRSFLKDDRLSVRFDAYNPFMDSYYGAPTHVVNGDYTGISVDEYRNKNIKLTIAYRFGSLNTRVKSTSKTITNDDVM